MDFKMTPEIVEKIFRMSEGAVSPIKGRVRGVVVDRIAHAGERHTAITNEDLWKRQGKNNEIEIFTAFLDFAQALRVAGKILNDPSVTPRLERLYYATEGKSGNAKDSGEEAITHDIGTLEKVRYKGPGGVLPTSQFTLVLHKKVGFPCNFMVYTFFPSLPM